MKKVEIENGTNIKSPWAAGFVEIAHNWEHFADHNNYSLKGYLNAYGVEIELTKRLFCGIPLTIKVEKRMETVKGSPVDLTPAQHSTVVIFYADLPPKLNHITIKVIKNHILSSVVLLWHSLRNQPKIKGFQVTSNHPARLQKVKDSGLLEANGFYQLKIKKSKFHCTFISFPPDKKSVENLVENVENLLE